MKALSIKWLFNSPRQIINLTLIKKALLQFSMLGMFLTILLLFVPVTFGQSITVTPWAVGGDMHPDVLGSCSGSGIVCGSLNPTASGTADLHWVETSFPYLTDFA